MSYMVKLGALLLCKCYELCHIPSLQLHGNLKRMDLSWCLKLEVLPDASERIPKIKDGVLLNLIKVQFLKLDFQETRGAEIAQLKYLEILRCNFLNDHEWNTYLQTKFKIIVGDKNDDNDDYDYDIDDDKEEAEKDYCSYKSHYNWK